MNQVAFVSIPVSRSRLHWSTIDLLKSVWYISALTRKLFPNSISRSVIKAVFRSHQVSSFHLPFCIRSRFEILHVRPGRSQKSHVFPPVANIVFYSVKSNPSFIVTNCMWKSTNFFDSLIIKILADVKVQTTRRSRRLLDASYQVVFCWIWEKKFGRKVFPS